MINLYDTVHKALQGGINEQKEICTRIGLLMGRTLAWNQLTVKPFDGVTTDDNTDNNVVEWLEAGIAASNTKVQFLVGTLSGSVYCGDGSSNYHEVKLKTWNQSDGAYSLTTLISGQGSTMNALPYSFNNVLFSYWEVLKQGANPYNSSTCATFTGYKILVNNGK